MYSDQSINSVHIQKSHSSISTPLCSSLPDRKSLNVASVNRSLALPTVLQRRCWKLPGSESCWQECYHLNSNCLQTSKRRNKERQLHIGQDLSYPSFPKRDVQTTLILRSRRLREKITLTREWSDPTCRNLP
jgi:hypothetical protein